MMKWEVGQTVMVPSRTWANINKPGGCAKILKVHRTVDGSYIEGLDVKYMVGGGRESNIDPAIVSPYEVMERGGRKRRSRDFLMQREEDLKKANKSRVRKKASGKENVKKEAGEVAVKENHSSPQSSASFSTPEKQKPAKKPKKVTPIPKMVITGRKIDYVSPMTEDILSLAGHRDTKKKEKTPVARGLVFDKVETKKKTKIKSKIPPSASVLNQPRSQAIKKPTKEGKNKTKASILIDKKPAAKMSMPPKKNPPTTTMSTSTNRDQPSKRKYDTIKTATKPKAVTLKDGSTSLGVATKPTPRYKPASASFSRVKSAYDKNKALSSRAVPEANRKPLLDVYRHEVEKAREFMDEMVGHRNDNDLGGLTVSNLKENARFIRTKSRYDEFLSNLYKVWFKVDEEEVSEERFKEVFNEVTSNSFTAQELDVHIQSLCDEGKEVMKSDGMLYRIH